MDRATLSDNTVASNQVSGALSNGVMLTAGANYNRVLGNRIGPDNGVGVTVAGDNNRIVGNFLLRNGTAYQDLGTGNTWLKNIGPPPPLFQAASTPTGREGRAERSHRSRRILEPASVHLVRSDR